MSAVLRVSNFFTIVVAPSKLPETTFV